MEHIPLTVMNKSLYKVHQVIIIPILKIQAAAIEVPIVDAPTIALAEIEEDIEKALALPTIMNPRGPVNPSQSTRPTVAAGVAT